MYYGTYVYRGGNHIFGGCQGIYYIPQQESIGINKKKVPDKSNKGTILLLARSGRHSSEGVALFTCIEAQYATMARGLPFGRKKKTISHVPSKNSAQNMLGHIFPCTIRVYGQVFPTKKNNCRCCCFLFLLPFVFFVFKDGFGLVAVCLNVRTYLPCGS